MFQGPVLADGRTLDCIVRTRQAFPGAEVVLSTWQGAETAGLPVDRLVLNEDPGAWRRDDGVWCNCNRQIISTLRGLQAASRTFAVKMRTDAALVDQSLMAFDLDGAPRPHQWRVFGRRIVVLNKFTRDPAKSSLVHFVSDLVQFGGREDLVFLWDIPLAAEVDYVGWSRQVRAWMQAPFPGHRTFMHHADEQYVWMRCIEKRGIAVRLDYISQCRLDQVTLSEGLLTTNFMVATEAETGVELAARFNEWAYPESCYSGPDWSRLVQVYSGERQSALVRRRWCVWLAARTRLLRLAAGRLWPGYVVRALFEPSNPVRRGYRQMTRFVKRSGTHPSD